MYNKSEFVIKMKQQSINDNDALKAFDIAIEVVKKFDGKVLNARLFNAINEALALEFSDDRGHNVAVSNGEYSLMLYARKNDWYCYGEPDKMGYRKSGYVEYSYYMNIGGNPKVAVDKDNRIIAAATIEIWLKAKKYIQDNMERYLSELERIDEIESEYLEIKNKMKLFNNKYSYVITQLFHINEY